MSQPSPASARAKRKRTVTEESDAKFSRRKAEPEPENMEMKFTFRVLLPNGSNLTLTLENTGEDMSVLDFIRTVKRKSDKENMEKGSRRIQWGNQIYLEDTMGNKIKSGRIIPLAAANKITTIILQDGGANSIHTYQSVRTKVIFSVSSVIVFVLCSLILGILWRQEFLRKHADLSNIMFRRLGYPKFTYQDLFNATNGFNDTNLLGVGNFGSVYKGILRDGKVVAIKVLNSATEEGQKSFKIECKVLERIRHCNLIRVISACSYLDFKGLVIQFASNGSLEKYLYLDNIEENVCILGLSECLNIAIDVAHGMEYLHYDCPIQVVHCDLKPDYVLLNANMSALVTDFGISRLTSSTNSMDSLSTTFSLRGSIGYIAPEYGWVGEFL